MADKIIKTQLHPQAPADTSDIIYPETSVDQVKGLPEPSVDNNNKVIIVTTEGYGTADYNKATKVRVGVTKTLPAGYSASVSNVGTPEEPILEFAIPQGIQGIQGKRGEQGAKGSSIESMNNNGYEVNGDYTQNDISATVINDSLPIDNPDHTLNYHYSVYAKNGELGSPVYYYSNIISGDSVTGLISDLVPINPVPKQNNLILTQNGLIMLINSITDTEFIASVVSDLKTFIESAVNGNGRFSKSLIPLTKNDLRIGNSSYPLNSIYTSHLHIMSKTANDTHFLAPLSYEYNSQNDSIFKIEFLDTNQVTAEKFGLDFRATRQNSISEVSFGQYNEDNSFGSTIPKLCLKYERQYDLDGYKQKLGVLDGSNFFDFRDIPLYINRVSIEEVNALPDYIRGNPMSFLLYIYSNTPIFTGKITNIRALCEQLEQYDISYCGGYIREYNEHSFYPIERLNIIKNNDVYTLIITGAIPGNVPFGFFPEDYEINENSTITNFNVSNYRIGVTKK